MEKTKEVKKQGNFAEKHPKLNLLLGLALIIAMVVIIPCFLVLAVCLGDIAVHTLSAARAFQDTGQDVGVVWIVDLFPLEGQSQMLPISAWGNPR